MHRLLGGLLFPPRAVWVRKSSGFNVKIALNGARSLMMLFFQADGPVLRTYGTQTDLCARQWRS
nr:hypothetical protein TEA_028052 [Ipomoea batatas]